MTMKILTTFTLLLCLAAFTQAKSNTNNDFTGGEFVGQIAGSSIGGAVGGGVGFFSGLSAIYFFGEHNDFFTNTYIVIGSTLAGSVVGTATGTSIVGNINQRNGKWWAATLGSASGMVLGGFAAGQLSQHSNDLVYVPLGMFTGMVAGSMAGYYTSDHFYSAPVIDPISQNYGVSFSLSF